MDDEVFNIEDALCRAFVMGLGTSLPSPEAIKNMLRLLSQKYLIEKL